MAAKDISSIVESGSEMSSILGRPSSTAILQAIGRPPFIYGTAWKKEATARLVQEALTAGFVAIDTAAQPKHYREDLVGDGIREVLKSGKLRRDQIFIQTKFTLPRGQDPHNMPYDASAPLATQIQTSIASSLHHLRPSTDPSSTSDSYIDALLLHSPLATPDLTLAAWRLLEPYALAPTRTVRALGISNVTLPELQHLHARATVKPSVVQNRFYGETGYDAPLRRFCARHGIVYQGFWTLTANPRLLGGGGSAAVVALAQAARVEREVALYCLLMGVGVVPLNGTTRADRMKSDLEMVGRVEEEFAREGAPRAEEWRRFVEEFREEVG